MVESDFHEGNLPNLSSCLGGLIQLEQSRKLKKLKQEEGSCIHRALASDTVPKPGVLTGMLITSGGSSAYPERSNF